MKAPNVIPLSPSVLIWARESLGMTQREVAAKSKRPLAEVHAWEAGEAVPSFAQLERLAADVYKRPLAVFFMKEPPEVPSLEQEFRTLDSAEVGRLSRKTRLAIRQFKARQLYLEDLFGSDSFERSGLSRLRVSAYSDPVETAAAVRRTLDFGLAEQRGCSESREVFNLLRGRLESQRVFTFQLSLDGIRGVALYDEHFPVIGIDSSDHHGARLFTLAHELGHILVKLSDFLDQRATYDAHSRLERFCNAFASELLLPGDSFSRELEAYRADRDVDRPLDIVRDTSRAYGVSHTVVARRLLDRGVIDQDTYAEMAKQFTTWHLASKAKQKEKPGKPSYYITKRSQLGSGYVDRAFELLDRGALDTATAADMLGVKIDNLSKLSDR